MSKLAATQVIYRERVTPKWTSFLPLTLILPTFWLTFAPINAFAGFFSGVLVSLATLVLMAVNSPVIEVSEQQLRVGKAKIPMKFVGKATLAPSGSRFSERVPNLDPRAYLALQNSQKGLIKLEISDKSDPTPYWVFSSKDPQSVIAALVSAKKN